MKNFVAEINVMPRKEILDPQGKAVKSGFKSLNIDNIEDVRIGKHITLHIAADSHELAAQKVEDACKKLLANPIMEFYEFQLSEQA